MTGLVWIVVWWVEFYSFIPCPLQNAVTAGKYGMKAHYDCPIEHGDFKEVTKRLYKTFDTEAEAKAYYAEVNGFTCNRYENIPTTNQTYDCVNAAQYGVDFSSNIPYMDNIQVPEKIIERWPE